MIKPSNSHSATFDAFARSSAVDAQPFEVKNPFEQESLAVARAYGAHVSGLRNAKGEPLHVSCGFLRDFGFNGVAGFEQGHHCCALDINLVGAMLDLSMTALSVPEVLPDIGNAGAEDSERVSQRDWPMGYALANADGLDDRKPMDRLTKPLDLGRRRCAVYLHLVALDLLWRHEIAHALLGHVGFARAGLNLKVLHERPSGGQGFDVLPLEVEADKHALLSCLDTASQDGAPFQVKDLDLTADQRRRCTLLAASLVLWFWAYLEKADRRETPGYEPAESHPPPGLRIMQLLTGVWEYFVRVTRDSDGLPSLMDGLHDDLRAMALAHPRFAILHPELLYASERREAAAAAHRIVAERRDAQAALLEPFRFFDEPEA